MGAQLTKHIALHDRSLYEPKGVHKLENIDVKKLRKLIRARRLAPFWAQNDQERDGREECPICNYWYPALNSASCCNARICTECFVMCQSANSPPGKASCPFCKQVPFAVKFVGRKTEAQVRKEVMEQQLVQEAKQRMLREHSQRQADHQPQRDAVQRLGSEQHALDSQHSFQSVQSSAAGWLDEVVAPTRMLAGRRQQQQQQRLFSSGPTSGQLAGAAAGWQLPQQQQQVSVYAGSTDSSGVSRQQHQQGASTQQQLQVRAAAQQWYVPADRLDREQQQHHNATQRAQHMQTAQQSLQQQQLPDELFAAELVPQYVRQELAGLTAEELEEIMIEQALIASLRQAAAAEAAAAAAALGAAAQQHALVANTAAAARQSSSQLSHVQPAVATQTQQQLQQLGVEPPPAAQVQQQQQHVTPSAAAQTQQQQQQQQQQRTKWASPMQVPLSRLVTWAVQYGSAHAGGTVVKLYMVGTDSASAATMSLAAAPPSAAAAAESEQGVPAAAAAVVAPAADNVAVRSDSDLAVSGYVLHAPALIKAMQAQAASSSRAPTVAAASYFTTLTEDQQQQQAAAVVAASMAVVQNPDGSLSLVTDLPGSLSVEQAAAAAVVPASEWALCDGADVALQRHLAAVDAQLVVKLADDTSAADTGGVCTASGSHAQLGAAARGVTHSSSSSVPATAHVDGDLELQQRLAAADAQLASRLAAACHGSSPVAVTQLDGENSKNVSTYSSASLHQQQQLVGEQQGAAGSVSTAAAAREADFVERLRQLDQAYAAALQQRMHSNDMQHDAAPNNR